MANDMCNVVKTDLAAGTYTRYTTSFPIYIQNQDEFEGGNVYIVLLEGKRRPTIAANGSIIYTEKSCTIRISAPSTTIRDNLLDDVLDILYASSNNYNIEADQIDTPANKELFEITIPIKITF